MISLQSLLFTALSGFAGLSALVGSRVYPTVAPQEVAKPYVCWQEYALILANNMSGSAGVGKGDNYKVQVTSWALTGTLARDVDAQVQAAIVAATGFKGLHLDTRALDYEPDTKLHGYQSDFSIWILT